MVPSPLLSPFLALLFPHVFFVFFSLLKGLYADFTYFFIFSISVTFRFSSANGRPGASYHYHSCLSLKVKLRLFFSFLYLLLGITPSVCVYPAFLSSFSSFFSFCISFLSIYPSSLLLLLQALSSSPLRLILNYLSHHIVTSYPSYRFHRLAPVCLSNSLMWLCFPSFSFGCLLHWKDGVGLLTVANERSEVRYEYWQLV